MFAPNGCYGYIWSSCRLPPASIPGQRPSEQRRVVCSSDGPRKKTETMGHGGRSEGREMGPGSLIKSTPGAARPQVFDILLRAGESASRSVHGFSGPQWQTYRMRQGKPPTWRCLFGTQPYQGSFAVDLSGVTLFEPAMSARQHCRV